MDKLPPIKVPQHIEMHTQSDRKHKLRNKKEDQSQNRRIKIGPRGSPRTKNLGDRWETMSYASRFLNRAEEKNSIHEIELLGVVWALEQFKHCL